MPDEAKISRKYWTTTMMLIVFLGVLMLGFWYMALGFEQFYIPVAIIVVAVLAFNYLIMPRMNSVLHSIYAKKK